MIPKEIAEKILKYEDKYETDTPVLARAYLELEKKFDNLPIYDLHALESEITKLKEENEKLKLQNQQLRKLNL